MRGMQNWKNTNISGAINAEEKNKLLLMLVDLSFHGDIMPPLAITLLQVLLFIWRLLLCHGGGGGRKAVFLNISSIDNISHFCNHGYFHSPSVMHFHRIGSVIICPTAKSLVFLTKCMCLWLCGCRVQRYLPLSAALGGLLCGASGRCCVPETLHLTKQDGFPASSGSW